jgi:hypothetical protein
VPAITAATVVLYEYTANACRDPRPLSNRSPLSWFDLISHYNRFRINKATIRVKDLNDNNVANEPVVFSVGCTDNVSSVPDSAATMQESRYCTPLKTANTWASGRESSAKWVFYPRMWGINRADSFFSQGSNAARDISFFFQLANLQGNTADPGHFIVTIDYDLTAYLANPDFTADV